MQTTKQSTFRILNYADLGLVDFAQAWELQKQLFEKRSKNEINDTLLLVEHPHTYTLGKGADKKNIIANKKFLQEKGISVFEIDRGGDVTYHGPGQVVGYLIFNLAEWEKDVHKFLRAIEEVIIKTCSVFGVKAAREEKYTGVWVGENKICAIGLKVTNWISMHGFALNVSTDLEFFKGIIPCGIRGKGVTSLEVETNRKIEVDAEKKSVLKYFTEVFDYKEIRQIEIALPNSALGKQSFEF